MRARTVFLWLLSTIGLPAMALAQLSSDTAASVDRVFADVDRTDTPGCVLGVNRNGAPLYRRGFGMANLELGVPLSEHSVLESGSVAKQFTAGAIVHLSLAGKLDLDAPVRTYVPELPDYGKPITVRMLLNHTSGIRDMWTLFVLAGKDLGTVLFNSDQALRMVYRQRELNFPPNSQYLYSNSGYLLLAEIVRRVGGKTLADYSRENFFEPLGMAETQWRNDWNRVVVGRATAYEPDGMGWRADMPFMNVYGAGGLLTTVGDLLRWNDNLDAPRVGGRAWADSLERRGRLLGGKDIDYALGLIVGTYRGDREVSHTGATGGYRTYLARIPSRRLSIAVLCNYGSAGPEALGHRVIDILTGRSNPAVAGGANAAAAPAVAAADYVGVFRKADTEELVSFVERGGKLALDLGAELALAPAGPDRFTAPQLSGEVTFQRDAGGRVASVELGLGGEGVTRYLRIAPPASTKAALAALAGTYYGEELDVSYLIRARDTTLWLEVPNRPEAPLKRTAEESFSGPAGSALRFVRDRTGRPTGFLLFAGRVRNLRFTKR